MRPGRIGLAVAATLMLGTGAVAQPGLSACAPAAQRIPPRANSAPAGSEFARRVTSMTERERDAAIRSELLAGNLPAFLRSAVPVEMSGRFLGGAVVHVVLCVLPDYLAIGADDDFVLMPMALDTALAVARTFGFTLPTRKIVDAVYARSVVHLAPRPLPAGDEMRTTAYYLRHNDIVRDQRLAVDAPLTALKAGHKKDLVATNRLWTTPGRVAIYGWHRDDGTPIQPLSTFHGARYADYSHGVRLVGETIYVDGRPAPIASLLHDRRMAPLLSDEGPLRTLDDRVLLPAAGEEPGTAGRHP